VSQAREFFDDIRVISPNGIILENQGIFTELPEAILGENRRLAYQGLSLFIISKSLADGTKILFVDDVTDAVESKNLMFENLLTSTFILGFFVIVIGWLFTQKIFSPIRKIVEAIEHFRLEQDPSEDAILLSGKQSDEFVRIAKNLESLFARIRVETSKIEDLSSNIAHELKNSLFGIASTLELALLQQHPKQKIEQALGQVIHL
jgi:signal transduction histidine kinase